MNIKQGSNKRKKHWVVAGGSLGGITAAYNLLISNNDVTLIESAPVIGGVNNSICWGDFTLDFGCHLFGNEDDTTTALLMDLMDNQVVPVDPIIASITNGIKTEHIEYPDLTSFGSRQVSLALYDLIENINSDNYEGMAGRSMIELLSHRYGVTTANIISDTLKKLTQTDVSNLSADCFEALPCRRVKIVNDESAKLLKALPVFDDLILRSSPDEPMFHYGKTANIFPSRAYYPLTGGMGGFSLRAHSKLEKMGAKIRLKSKINNIECKSDTFNITFNDTEKQIADGLIWAAGGETLSKVVNIKNNLDAQIHKIPLILYYFDMNSTQASKYSYIHDFDDTHFIYRASIPSNYAPNVCPEGRSYLCCEIPTNTDSDIWNSPEKYEQLIWDEALSIGIVTGIKPLNSLIKNVPVSYKFPKVNLYEELQPIISWIKQQKNIFLLDQTIFAKSSIVRYVSDICSELS